MTRFAFTAIPVQRGLASAAGAAMGTRGALGVITGRREAPDERTLRDELHRGGLVAIDVRPVSMVDALRARVSSDRPRRVDTAWFIQTLRLLLESAVPLDSAFTSMVELAPTPRIRRACEQVREAVRAGKPLAESMESVPGLATPQASALLRAGHESGRLPHAVALIEASMSRTDKLRRAVAGKLAYPALVVVVAIGVLWYLSASVIPKFAEVLSTLGGELPLSTAITLSFAKWFVWVAPIAALIGVFVYLRRNTLIPAEWRREWAERLLRAPIVGPLLWSTHGAVVCEMAGTMIEGGGDVLAGLQQAERVVGSQVIARRVAAARQRVREGADPGEALALEKVLPPTASTIVRVGVRGGDLSGSLRRAGAACAEQQERTTQKLMFLLEPATVVLMAISVGWVIFSLVQGMMALNRAGSL